MLTGLVSLALYASGLLTCSAAEQDRRFVIAVAKDEGKYAVAKILLQRQPTGEISGAAFHCVHDTRTNALDTCSAVENYAYPKELGATVQFHHDFFVDKVRRVQEQFLAKQRRFVAAYQHQVEREENPESTHHHLPPEPASHGLAVWRALSQVGDGKVVQKPIFFVWQTLAGGVQVAYREEAEREVSVERELHTSEEALFYVGPKGKRLFAAFSQRMGSVMHDNRIDLVLPFAKKRFEPFRVTVINGSTRQYLPVVQRLGAWKVPYTTDRKKDVLQPVVKARAAYLPLAEHLVDTGFRFLGDQEWLVVSNRDAKEHLRFELPYHP